MMQDEINLLEIARIIAFLKVMSFQMHMINGPTHPVVEHGG